MDYKLLSLSEVIERTTLSRTNIYKRISLGTFPKPIKIGARMNGWIASEVDQWIEDRIKESRGDILEQPQPMEVEARA